MFESIKLSKLFGVFVMVVFIGLSSCGGGGGGSSSSSSSVKAPDTIAGKVALVRITYGEYPFANTGKALEYFYSDGTYRTIGDGYYVADSNGKYAYSTNGGSKATIKMNDVYLGATTATLTFDTDTSGTFVMVDSDGHKQGGTFEIANQ